MSATKSLMIDAAVSPGGAVVIRPGRELSDDEQREAVRLTDGIAARSNVEIVLVGHDWGVATSSGGTLPIPASDGVPVSLLVARAVGHGPGAPHTEVQHALLVDPSDDELEDARRGVTAMYVACHGHSPARVAAVVLPWTASDEPVAAVPGDDLSDLDDDEDLDAEDGERFGIGVCATGICDEPCGRRGGCAR